MKKDGPLVLIVYSTLWSGLIVGLVFFALFAGISGNIGFAKGSAYAPGMGLIGLVFGATLGLIIGIGIVAGKKIMLNAVNRRARKDHIKKGMT